MPRSVRDHKASDGPNVSIIRQLAPYMALGTQLTASIILVGGLGWLVDHYMASDPWGLVIGLILGSVLGFVQFLRSVQRLLSREREEKQKEK